MIFEETPKKEQRKVALKLMCLMAHLECAIDLAYELDFHPFVRTFHHNKSSEKFKKEAGVALKNTLYAFKSDQIENTDDIQLEVFAIIRQIKELNMEAINNTSLEINDITADDIYGQ